MQRYQNSLHFKFFPISVEGGGHRKSIFSQIQKSPNYPRGGGGQENYGLFPQIMVFFILNRPLSIMKSTGTSWSNPITTYYTHDPQETSFSIFNLKYLFCFTEVNEMNLKLILHFNSHIHLMQMIQMNAKRTHSSK